MNGSLHVPAGEPAATLKKRVHAELSAEFDPSHPIQISQAPGRLDVMGGIAQYTGSMVLQATIDRAAAVVLQERADRAVQVFSFNQLDAHQPFTLQIPLDSLVTIPVEKLREGFDQPGRQWAARIVGCLHVLHEQRLVDLANPAHHGLNFAMLSTIPSAAGLGSSAAIEVATLQNLVEHFDLRERVDAMTLAVLCQKVEQQLLGNTRGIASQVTSCLGEPNSLLRMVCQPHELQASLPIPTGIQFIGIHSGVQRTNTMYDAMRCATSMGHVMILQQMRVIGESMGRELAGDPMRGYLANLDPDDYKRTFRKYIPEAITGQEYLDRFGPLDSTMAVDPNQTYPIQHATDHHVLEARRVQRFAEFVDQAGSATGPARKLLLDKAGHLMYASHLSYTNDAMLGADECDLLVSLVREREPAGFYGARITAGGSGGTVAILGRKDANVHAAIDEIMDLYEKQTGKKPEAFFVTSPDETRGTATE